MMMFPQNSPLQIIPARKLGGPESRFTLLLPKDVAFVFVGAALFNELIKAAGKQPSVFKPQRLYLRTRAGAYYVSTHRSMKDLVSRFTPGRFLPIQQSLAVNIHFVREIDFREKQIGLLLADQKIVWLTISRRYIKPIRERLFCSLARQDFEE